MVFHRSPGSAHLGGLLKLDSCWEFPGGLVVRIPGFHCHDLGSVPNQGTEILKIMLINQEEKKKLKSRFLQGTPDMGVILSSAALECVLDFGICANKFLRWLFTWEIAGS